eukprot:scaffold80579_cov63-Phaeocystis_antarctica.AAC.1
MELPQAVPNKHVRHQVGRQRWARGGPVRHVHRAHELSRAARSVQRRRRRVRRRAARGHGSGNVGSRTRSG